MDSIDVEAKKSNELTGTQLGKVTLLKERFVHRFAEEPEFYARAPGRVNLIGEHIDYCGYSVFPMAIANDIMMAVSPNTANLIRLTNIDPQFEDFTISTLELEITNGKPHWYNYFLCGLLGIKEKFQLEAMVGMNVCVHGTIPKSSGLSSSSAMVVCAALSALIANNLSLTKTQLAELCAISERHIGTQGGGMDQAISCLAKSGTAKLIDFNPLRVTDVNLPDGSLFVITNSCVEANKAATNQFNKRVVECRLAAQVLAKMSSIDWRKIKKLLEIQTELGLDLGQMITLVEQKLHKEPFTKQELCELLQVTEEEMATTSLSPNTLDLQSFELYKRATHVFSEAKRVHEFKEACGSPSDALNKLGELMNQSHASCRVLYECSCPELDELTEICRSAGAYGSRLTGAGWGGCAVSLIPKNILGTFLEQVKKEYYSKNAHLLENYHLAAFATAPSDGISVFKLE